MRPRAGRPSSAWRWCSSPALIFAIPSLFAAVKVVSDGPIYHLYFAARWWKAGRLILVAAPFGENAATYFPANGDLWFTWLMATWGGDTLAKVGQAPFLLLAGAAAYGCARLLGAGRSASTIATCWFVSSTPLLLYSFEPNVDTIFVAGYLLAAYFFLRYARADGGTPALVLGALAAGEALGTKPIGVVFVPPLLALVIAGLLLRRAPWRVKLAPHRDRRDSSRWSRAATGSSAMPVLTGNPLYPLDVRVLGRTSGPAGTGPTRCGRAPTTCPSGDWRALADIVLAILDPRLAPLWLAAIAGAWAVGNPRTRPVRPLDRAVRDHGRAQRRPLLDRDPLPDPAAIHAPGPRAGRRPAGRDARPRPMAARRRPPSCWPCTS